MCVYSYTNLHFCIRVFVSTQTKTNKASSGGLGFCSLLGGVGWVWHGAQARVPYAGVFIKVLGVCFCGGWMVGVGG